jgi:hypothetical protein
MIKQQTPGSIGAGLATALAVAALACATFARAQDVQQQLPSGSAGWSSPNNGLRPATPDVAAPDSVEGRLRSEGKSWQRTTGPIWVGSYVQDILAGRLDQPNGRGVIAKVLSTGEYIGMEHAWVDFGRDCIEHIRTSELSPIRIVPAEMRPPLPPPPTRAPDPPVPMPGLAQPGLSVSDMAAPDSVEGQFRSEGQRWELARGPIQVGIYVQDIWPNRLNQPAGRGLIGKVVYMHPGADGRARAMVDFGRGYVVDIFPAELSPIRIFASDIAAADSVEGQLRAEGTKWERTRAQMSVGSYVQDILQGRRDQPAGRGQIGKVASLYVDEQGRAVARVDFGRGWIVGIFTSELSPIRILAPAASAGDESSSTGGQFDPILLHATGGFYKTIIDPQFGQFGIVNPNRTDVILKDNAGRTVWSTNVVAAWMALNPQAAYAGEFIINYMESADDALVVGFTGGTASIDKRTGAVKFQGPR